jgi:hypothetical protein
MNEPSVLAAVTVLVLKTVTALAIPLVVERVTSRFFERLAPSDLRKVPTAVVLPRLLGLLLGLILVYDRYGWRNFDLQLLFAEGGPWDLSLGQFLAGPANPLNYGLGTLNEFFARRPTSDESIVVTILVVGMMLGTVLSPFAFWSPPQARRVVLCNIGTAAVATYLTVDAFVLLVWLLFLLNFWTFALIVALFQYYRSRA